MTEFYQQDLSMIVGTINSSPKDCLSVEKTWIDLWSYSIRSLIKYLPNEELIILQSNLLKFMKETEKDPEIQELLTQESLNKNWIELKKNHSIDQILDSGIIVFLSIPIDVIKELSKL